MAIADPANGKPNLRFANRWYVNGGWYPLGIVSTEDTADGGFPTGFEFDDPRFDESIRYDLP